MKFETAQIHFLGDIFAAVIVVIAFSFLIIIAFKWS